MFVDIAVGETLTVGDTTVRLQFKSGKKARLRIEAPPDLAVSINKDPTTPTETRGRPLTPNNERMSADKTDP